MQPQTHGFTFIEVMFSIALGFILLTAGTISLINFRIHQNLENEARALATLLISARNSAIQSEEGARWGVWVENTKNPRPFYALFKVNEILAASSSYTGIPGDVVSRRPLRSGLELASPAVDSTLTVLFTKHSGVPDQTAEFTIQIIDNPVSSRTVTVSTNGLIDYQ